MDVAALITWLTEYTTLALNFLSVYLPDSPFSIPSILGIEDYIGYIKYFIPFDDILRVTSLWGTACLFYYDVSIFMRYFKVIS